MVENPQESVTKKANMSLPICVINLPTWIELQVFIDQDQTKKPGCTLNTYPQAHSHVRKSNFV